MHRIEVTMIWANVEQFQNSMCFTNYLWVSSCLCRTFARSSMRNRHTLCVLPTSSSDITRILAAVVDAGCCSRTVRIREAISRFATACLDRITDQPISAWADVTSWCVLTTKKDIFYQNDIFEFYFIDKHWSQHSHSWSMTRFGETFVNVWALSIAEHISFEASTSALMVHSLASSFTTMYIVARIWKRNKETLSRKAVEGRVKWKRRKKLTCAFVVLIVAQFVSRTVLIANTFHFEAAQTQVSRISQMSSRTRTCSQVVEYVADGICGASLAIQTRIRALTSNAGQVVGTIWVLWALIRQQASGLQVRVSHSPWRTLTSVRA